MANRINVVPHHTSVVTAATIYPVTVDEVKSYLRDVYDEDDALILDWIKAATDELEKATCRSFINQTFKDSYDCWPLTDGYYAVCHRAPLSSVSSIAYIDSDGNSQTWSSSYYDVDTTREPGRISIAWGASLPAIRDDPNAVAITYVAGYGATATNVPPLAKHYIYTWIAAAHCRRPAMDDEIRAMTAAINVLSYGLNHGG